MRMTSSDTQAYLYHDPCHSPMKHYTPIEVARTLTGKNVVLSDRCCGEAGTFAVSRPDIATQVRYRKQNEIHKGIEVLTGKQTVTNNEVKMLTSCPACQQGLSRYQPATGLQTEYIVVEMAANVLGKDWQNTFIRKVQNGGIERILL